MYLMLLDTPVLYFNIDEFVVQVIREDLLPFSLRGRLLAENTMQTLLHNTQLIKEYLSSRVLSLSRDNAKQIYCAFGIPQRNDVDTRVKICLACSGVAITDSYWVKSDDSNQVYADVNIRHKSFKNMVEIALNGVVPTVTQSYLNPELTTHGLFKKAWTRVDSELYLLKSDKHMNNINTRMEVLASNVLDCFSGGLEHISYTGRLRTTKSGKVYVNKCKNFVDDDFSFVEAWEVMQCSQVSGVDYISEVLGFSKKASSIAVLDFIISNTDRHTQNYGFMMSNKTGKLVGLAPLFDFNCALVSDYYGVDASVTLSQMFNDGRSLRQVADTYKPYVDLVLDTNKFTKLKLRYKDYSNIFENILVRCEVMNVRRV